MASTSRDANGTKRVLFTDGHGERRSVRLGRASVKAAESFRLRVEALLAAKELHQSPDAELSAWLRDLPERMYARLARVGLVESRTKAAVVTLGAMLEAFAKARDVKPSTLVRLNQTRTALVEHFGEAHDANAISEADAEAWRAQLRADGYATATVSKHVQIARQMFRWGMRRGMVKCNPFAEVRAGSQVNTARQAFIDRPAIAAVLDACPDAEWRLLVALSRFGGLRLPSEGLGLRWSDVDWERNRLTIRSPKTEHHAGHGDRIIPLFPELRGPLMEAFTAAPDGAEYVLSDRFRNGYNPHTHFLRIIRRAGVKPWPRLWHNLRASRQTELAASFPLHTVCAWIGNSKAVAAGHYLQLTDADWTRAVGERQSGADCGALAAQNAAQHPTAPVRTEAPDTSGSPCFAEVSQSDANECEAAANRSSGRYWTRTSDLTGVIRAF